MVELDLPADVLIVLIQREGDILVPRGGTQLNEKDVLLVLSERESPADIASLLL